MTSGKVKNGSLLAADFKSGQLSAGPAGAPGAKGDAGAPGAKGDAGTPGANGATNVVVRQGAVVSVPSGTTAAATASCAAGERATGGGSSISGSAGWAMVESFPTPGSTGSTPTGWRVDATNNTGATNNLVAIVICASP